MSLLTLDPNNNQKIKEGTPVTEGALSVPLTNNLGKASIKCGVTVYLEESEWIPEV